MGDVQTGVQNAHPPGDIHADGATDDHSALVRIERGHRASRRAIARTRIRQRIDSLDYARQTGHLDDLWVDRIVHDADQVLGGE